VTVRLVAPDEVDSSWSGTPTDAWETIHGDGSLLRHELGPDGEQRVSYASASFHISAGGRTILCAPQDPHDAGWQRQLLDTILCSASFLNGFELLHAGAVEWDEGVIAISSHSGGGKSSIVAELVRRGHRLFCDDVLAIGSSDGALVCHAAPAVMNLPAHSVAPEELGASVIAPFGHEGELWITLPTAPSPRPLLALYLLDRSADRRAASVIARPTPLDLLPSAISLPCDPERARTQFCLFSMLAESVAVFRLTADWKADPAALADLVEGSLRQADITRPAAIR
jgi:hypothetical protein